MLLFLHAVVLFCLCNCALLNFDHGAHSIEGLRKGIETVSPRLREGRDLRDSLTPRGRSLSDRTDGVRRECSAVEQWPAPLHHAACSLAHPHSHACLLLLVTSARTVDRLVVLLIPAREVVCSLVGASARLILAVDH